MHDVSWTLKALNNPKYAGLVSWTLKALNNPKHTGQLKTQGSDRS